MTVTQFSLVPNLAAGEFISINRILCLSFGFYFILCEGATPYSMCRKRWLGRYKIQKWWLYQRSDYIRCVFPMFKFTTYHHPSPPLWEFMENIIFFLWNFCHYQKVCIPRSVCILLPALTYSRCYTRLPLVNLEFGSVHMV